MFRSSREAYFGLSIANYGQADIGVAQATGTVSAAVTYNAGAQTKLTISGGTFTENDSIQVAGTTDYNGVHSIAKVVSATEIVINVAWTSDQSGTWDRKAAAGAFGGFIPMTTLNAGDISSITFQDPKAHKGDPKPLIYIAGVFYPFPGIITEIILGAGNARMLRYSTNNPL